MSAAAPWIVGALILLALILLARKGGKSSSARMFPAIPTRLLIAHYGDSLTASGSVPRIATHMPQSSHVDRAYGGTQAGDLLAGHRPPLADMEPFAQFVQTEPATVLVVRFGGVAAVRSTPPDVAATDLAEVVRLAKAAGKRIVLVGRLTLPDTAAVNEDFRTRYERIDQDMRALAARESLPYIDVSGVPIESAEMFDEIHPGAVAQERVAVVIARQLSPLV